MCGISKPDQWEGAQALYVVGSLAANVVNAFYAATFPSLVRDLPKVIESEESVRLGTQSAEEHNKLDAYERSKVGTRQQYSSIFSLTNHALAALQLSEHHRISPRRYLLCHCCRYRRWSRARKRSQADHFVPRSHGILWCHHRPLHSSIFPRAQAPTWPAVAQGLWVADCRSKVRKSVAILDMLLLTSLIDKFGAPRRVRSTSSTASCILLPTSSCTRVRASCDLAASWT